jgi:RecJ-like exonuclease
MTLFETITIAMNEPDLGNAVAHLQRVCGITDKANAYRWFDCIADAQWEANQSGSRIALLMDYLGHEYTFKDWQQAA